LVWAERRRDRLPNTFVLAYADALQQLSQLPVLRAVSMEDLLSVDQNLQIVCQSKSLENVIPYDQGLSAAEEARLKSKFPRLFFPHE
jgi:hypothetical protein